MARRSTDWPERPWVEGEALEDRLDAIAADDETREFARALAQTGVAHIDLGAPARALCDEVVAQTDPRFDRGVTRIQDAWLGSRAVRRLATDAKVRRLLEAAYGRPAFAFQTLNFRVGTQQETHSDAIHFHSVPERFMCGVWIALEDISTGSGPLAYRPGSHRLPVLTMRGAGVNHPGRPTVNDYRTVYAPALKARLDAQHIPASTAVLRKGQALVWAANLAHGGSPITDPAATRRSLVTHYFFKGCLYYTPMVSEVEDGRFAVRLPANIQTGGVEWPVLNGRPVLPRLGQFAGAARKLLLRHQPVE